MNKKKKKTNLEELYERMLKEYDKDHPGMRSLMRQINADKKYHEHDNTPYVWYEEDLFKEAVETFTEEQMKELQDEIAETLSNL